jgi:multiple sugar transport system ATP-binding protein
MVFQSYALYPHMTVRQNLGYGLKVRRTKKSEAARRVTEVARLLRLDDLLDRRPAELSGGQRQRVAMGRAIVREPKAFLMDEPLSNLDAKLRVGMRAELVSLHNRLGTTTVYVTHDQVEAMTLGRRVAVMRDGRIEQVDRPQVLYRLPQTLFVAAFIGSPAMNLVEAVVEGGVVQFGGFRIALPPLLADSIPAGRVVLGIRPESFEDVAFADPSLPQIDVVVNVLEELGSDSYVVFSIDAPRVDTEELRETLEGEDASLLAGDQAVFHARVDPRTAATAGAPLRPLGRAPTPRLPDASRPHRRAVRARRGRDEPRGAGAVSGLGGKSHHGRVRVRARRPVGTAIRARQRWGADSFVAGQS